jgi:hypothetical protein
VSSITDPEMIKKAEQKDRDERKQELNDLRTVLGTISGRRLMWRILIKCNTFATIFNKDISLMSYLAGKQDLGHFLMQEISESDNNLMLKLMRENQGEE